MSASRDKKSRQEISPEILAEREQQKLLESKKEKKTNMLYAGVGVLCALLLVVVVLWNTGMIQRNVAAVTVKGEKYTVAEAQYYYNTTKQGVLNFYYSNLGMYPFNTSTSLKNQVYNSETNQTWYDYLLSQTMDTMASYDAIAAEANAKGYVMSAEAKEYLDSQLAELQNVWKDNGYKDLDSFIKANYGSYMTYEKFEELFTKSILVNDYTNYITTEFNYGDADYETYYKEHANQLDTFDITQFVFRAAPAASVDANGNTVELTEEETAKAMEESKKEVEAIVADVEARLKKGEAPTSILADYEEAAYSYDIVAPRMGTNVNSSYQEWAYDAARKAGDVTTATYDATGAVYYYVARWESRMRDETPTADVRHILVAAEMETGAIQPNEEQFEAAKAEAQKLLDQWEAGEATEDSFAALAQEHSADGSSAANGGLITQIDAHSNYVETFANWALDPARQPGDTGLVKNIGSTTMGYHVMYYVGDNQPVWKLSADSNLRSEAYTAWEEGVMEGYEAKAGMGLKFLEA